MTDDFIALAKLCGAIDYTPPPMRAIRGVSFTYLQLGQFIDKVIDDNTDRAGAELLQSVFLDLLGQVRTFIDKEGEADFWTGPAEAMRWTLERKTPPQHLQEALAEFLLKRAAAGGDGKNDG